MGDGARRMLVGGIALAVLACVALWLASGRRGSLASSVPVVDAPLDEPSREFALLEARVPDPPPRAAAPVEAPRPTRKVGSPVHRDWTFPESHEEAPDHVIETRVEPAVSDAPPVPTYAIRGIVLDDLGTVVPSFTVSVSPSPRSAGRAVGARGREGAFELTGLTAGSWSLRVTASDLVQVETFLVTVPSNAPLVVRLAHKAEVRGLVLDELGRGVPFASVSARTSTSTPGGSTDLEGAFQLANLTPGTVTVSAWHRDRGRAEPETIEIAPGELRGDLVLRIGPSATLCGIVLDERDRPRTVTTVSLESPRDGTRSTRTDGQGRFCFEGLVAGDAWVTADVGTLSLRKQVSLRPGEREDVVLRLAADDLVQVNGTISLGGRPVGSGVVLAAPPADAEGLVASAHIANGTYSLAVPGPGPYDLRVICDGWMVQERLDVPSVHELVHDVTLDRATVSGRVVDAHGRPLSGLKVWSLQRDGSRLASSYETSDVQGGFTLTVVPGAHGLYVTVEGSDAASPAPLQTLTIGKNDTVEDVELVVR